MTATLLIIHSGDVDAKGLASTAREKGFAPSLIEAGRWHLHQGDTPRASAALVLGEDALRTVEKDLNAAGIAIIKTVGALKKVADMEIEEVLPPAPVPRGAPGAGTAASMRPGGPRTGSSPTKTSIAAKE